MYYIFDNYPSSLSSLFFVHIHKIIPVTSSYFRFPSDNKTTSMFFFSFLFQLQARKQTNLLHVRLIVYTCVHVHIHVYMYTIVCMCTCMCTYICSMYVCSIQGTTYYSVYTNMYVCIVYMYMSTCTYIHVHVHMYVYYIHVTYMTCAHVHMYECMCAHTCMSCMYV